MEQDLYKEPTSNTPPVDSKSQELVNHSNSENWSSLIVEGMEEALFSLDRQWRFTYLNEKTAKLWGRSKQSLLGKSLWEEFPTLVGTSFEMLYRQVMADDSPGRIEDFSQTTQQWYEVRAYPIPEGLIVYFQNISARKGLEKSLQDSEYRFKFLSDITSEAVVVHWDGKILEANQSAARLYGYNNPAEVIGLPIAQLMTDQSLKDFQNLLSKNYEGPFETVIVPKNGNPFYAQAQGKSVEFRGQRVRLALVRDITEIKEREQQLRESEERYRILSEASYEGLTIFSEGKIVEANHQIAEMFGYSLEEFVGLTPEKIVAAEELVTARQRIATNSTASTENTGLRKDGTTFPYEARGRMIEYRGRPARLMALRDLTGIKQAEEVLRKTQAQLLQSQKLEGIGRLAGGISHDFNNLLMAIIGYSEIILKSFKKEDPNYEYLNEIMRAGQRASDLTRQLLIFSRQRVLQPRVVNLNQMVTDMDKLLHRLIGEDIEILSVPDPELEEVLADPGQIEQVILNLAVNARDAMPDGGKLTIETANVELDEHYQAAGHPQVKTGSYVMLAVSDTGTGMDEATQQRIFEPFFTTKEVGKGTGLGLATVYGIVEQSEGYIIVYSEVGIGTTFKIYLPTVKTGPVVVTRSALSHSPQAQVTNYTYSGASQGEVTVVKNITVLVVEDEKSVRHLIQRVLGEAGYTILEATNGKEALELVNLYSAQVDVVLTDIIMPKMSGRELVNQLKLRWPDLKVICMSGYTDRGVVRHELLERCDNFLQKPFTSEVLLDSIKIALRAKPG